MAYYQLCLPIVTSLPLGIKTCVLLALAESLHIQPDYKIDYLTVSNTTKSRFIITIFF